MSIFMDKKKKETFRVIYKVRHYFTIETWQGLDKNAKLYSFLGEEDLSGKI